MNNQLKNLIENYQTYLTYKRSSKKEELCLHEVPNYPWAKVGADLFYFDSRNYLLIVDYYSKFIEVIELTSTLSESIIYHLKSVFSRQGIPETLVTDCGPQFTSRGDFKILPKNGNSSTLKHLHTIHSLMAKQRGQSRP